MEAEQELDQPGFDIWKADRIEKIFHFQPEHVVLRGPFRS